MRTAAHDPVAEEALLVTDAIGGLCSISLAIVRSAFTLGAYTGGAERASAARATVFEAPPESRRRTASPSPRKPWTKLPHGGSSAGHER